MTGEGAVGRAGQALSEQRMTSARSLGTPLPHWEEFSVSAVVFCAEGLAHSMGDMRGWCCRVMIALN